MSHNRGLVVNFEHVTQYIRPLGFASRANICFEISGVISNKLKLAKIKNVYQQ